ncbi:DUF896 domain-containing protein [Lutispora saccharofermentans]|uniref:UPF0291 protein LJD61_10625 n=1 Tax=Lutispora saccharofermentans TaxID=3024236 RepID=A0ABT1NFG1_9FIRM|nr:DUF896 domain-containing protein [Lutispora saccharofermentans]MCQ1529997.1 DUF896 domain-containing protein [Lutispora saccharofermentans]
MITKEDIGRINFLAKKSKDAGLTEEEKDEQQRLRRKYIDWVKSQVKAQLDTIEITDSHSDCGCGGHEHKHGHGCNCHKN